MKADGYQELALNEAALWKRTEQSVEVSNEAVGGLRRRVFPLLLIGCVACFLAIALVMRQEGHRLLPAGGDNSQDAFITDVEQRPCWSWRGNVSSWPAWGGPWGHHWYEGWKDVEIVKPLTHGAKIWTELPVSKYANRSPKLGILMFGKNKVGNAQLWRAWIEQARSEGLSFKLLIHAYGIDAPEQFETKDFFQYLVHEKAQTSWGNISEAEMLLVRRALEDGDVTHMVTVSEDSVPLKTLGYVYKQLGQDSSTRLCADLESGEGIAWVHAETWWAMRRDHLQLFADNWELVRREFSRRSTEEKSWMYPLLLRMVHWSREAVPLSDECVMYTDWSGGCNHWADHAALCDCPKLRVQNPASNSDSEPTVFNTIGIDAWLELVKSPFWWGRKFADGALNATDLGGEQAWADEPDTTSA